MRSGEQFIRPYAERDDLQLDELEYYRDALVGVHAPLTHAVEFFCNRGFAEPPAEYSDVYGMQFEFSLWWTTGKIQGIWRRRQQQPIVPINSIFKDEASLHVRYTKEGSRSRHRDVINELQYTYEPHTVQLQFFDHPPFCVTTVDSQEHETTVAKRNDLELVMRAVATLNTRRGLARAKKILPNGNIAMKGKANF